ncbi:NADP-dependent oxidoreductase domain-containing protein [Kockovaella imperatae]|uniref:NADP-dependent oxidoreductase domain-containing protein n=1 Tax=Kockovaella imperatae TaxID=4999 RepID=A0A1Y1ULS6_9TREE|nr:NADP-dependent oxidoreductase domain-containing protein [Kockovaella imperatae]ORX38993.1 NADP-dependent oxidoreductase domain-containing protein [Kockovaella imperatae]
MPGPQQNGTEAISAGHVSMMNDVLISQLSPDVLRGVVRTLLGANHTNASLFTSVTRAYLEAHPPTIPDSSDLFPTPFDASNITQEPTECLKETLREARIRFSAHMLGPALLLLASIPRAMLTSNVFIRDTPGPLRDTLVYAAGDMAQAAQALKESGDRSIGARGALVTLVRDLYYYHQVVQKEQSLRPNDNIFNPLERAVAQTIDTLWFCFPDHSGIPFQEPEYTKMHNIRRTKKALQTTLLGPIKVPRLFYGLWQLSSPAWGTSSLEDITQAMSSLASLGFIAADMADHYADAEILFGNFRNHIMFPSTRPALICATKYCQFAPVPSTETIDREWVLARVQERSNRVKGVVDLLQVHWQHLSDKRYLDVFVHLVQISQRDPDLLRAVGLCNFDTKTMVEICEHLNKTIGQEAGIVSNQVQYSLIDHRPRFGMAQACIKYGVKLVTYGTFCGGFLSDRWVGMDEPSVYKDGFNTSQRKYLDMIKAWGGWELFQELLETLKGIAESHNVSVANVAARWVLDQPETGVVIIGSRLGVTSHDEANLKIDSFRLSDEDMAAIEKILERSRGRQMFEQIGDCGAEYR